MLDTLGLLGIVGIVAIVIGIALMAIESLVIAAGFALVMIGLGLVVKAVVSGMLRTWGMM